MTIIDTTGGSFELGLDIGVASVGWAVVRTDPDGRKSIAATGAHLFEAGTDGSQADILKGKDTPRGQQRRMARQMRRMIWRRARRKRAVLRALIDAGLLPAPSQPLKLPADIDAYCKAMDRELLAALPGRSHRSLQVWPYILRERAAAGEVTRHELGRALYHLAQRRGFKSNRRAERGKPDEDLGAVKQSIGELQAKVEAHPVPTLGAYLASLDPDEARIRGRWTSRAMFESEFDRIWTRQEGVHGLTSEHKRKLWRAMFHQRPLKSQKGLIGRCSLLPAERRAPTATRAFQRFRLLDRLNNLEILDPLLGSVAIAPEQRQVLIAALSRDGDISFAQVKKLLGLPSRATRFNLEEGGEKKLVGHRTDARLRAVFGDDFDGFSEADKDRMVEDLRSFRLQEPLERRAQHRWGLSPDRARDFASINLEDDYGSLSLAAIARLLPGLESGRRYAEVRKELFPESFKSSDPAASLPPVESVDDIRNPSVSRALTEVRKLVNALVRRFGKPAQIRVEMARDLKQPRSIRERITRENREREAGRAEIAARILSETGIHAGRADIERVLLAQECGWTCPYSGRSFGIRDIVGREPQFDVEHIWPLSRCLDDSLANKTLCYHEENRARKRNRTPFEAYAGGLEWDAILERVRRFKGNPFQTRAKLARFVAEEIDSDFANRHLSDTRYASRAVADYLGLLYGGRTDADGKNRVTVSTGGLTAWLRSGWGLAGMLGDGPAKNREDHRHHALDAVVVALTTQRAVQVLARAAASASESGKRRAFEHVEEPWPGFRAEVERAIAGIVVSHRQSRKVSGPLHNDSLYSKPHTDGHRIRKELSKLSPDDIAKGRIIDPRALEAIRRVLETKGKPSPTLRDIQQIFGDPANAPLVRGPDGKMVRLRKVRVRADAAVPLSGGASRRYVQTASNHHTVIFANLSSAGVERSWGDEPVTLLECYRRKDAGEPVVKRDLGPARKFLFSLAPNEFLEMDRPDDATKRALFRVLGSSRGRIMLCDHADARPSHDCRFAKSADALRKLRARKVVISYLGEIKHAGG